MFLGKWFTEENKLKKSDIAIIITLSVIILVFTLAPLFSSYFYNVGQSNQILKSLNFILYLPIIVLEFSLFYFFKIFLGYKSSGDGDLGIGLLATFLSPFLIFIFWFGIFYVITKISIKCFKKESILAKHGISLAITILITVPYLFYLIGL